MNCHPRLYSHCPSFYHCFFPFFSMQELTLNVKVPLSKHVSSYYDLQIQHLKFANTYMEYDCEM
jgi:hypothetical protein